MVGLNKQITNKCQEMYNDLIPIREISRKLDISPSKISNSINLKVLYKKCKYCGKKLSNKDHPISFHRIIICNSKGCVGLYRRDRRRSNKKYYRLKGKEWRKKNPNYLKEWRSKNKVKVKEQQRKSDKKYWAKNGKRLKENLRIKENIRRENLGLPLIGQRYRKEYELFTLIKRTFPNNEIYQGKRVVIVNNKDKRKNLQIDIYLPELKLGFEYMGEQHYVERSFNHLTKYSKKLNNKRKHITFNELIRRDKLKEKICKKMGITLIKIKYNEKLSEQLIFDKLKDKECINYEK